MFRRRLREGRDVFNVATPSKQKDYLIYLVKVEHERLRKCKKRIIQFPKLRDMLERHDSKMAARMDGLGIGRVRRTISRIPKDFATRPTSPNIPYTNEQDEEVKTLSSAELELFDNRMRRKKFKMEMDSLKRLITIKRDSNSKLKGFKKARVEGTETFLRSGVTSNVTGRVRKANSRYGGDFALCKRDIDEMIYADEIQIRLKRSESENKKRVENMKKDNERFARKRQISSKSSVKSSSVKRPKSEDLVIDNPEEDDITQYETGIKKINLKKAGKAKGDAVKLMLNAHRTMDEQANVKIPSVNANKMSKKKQNYNGDGVLIQDMPKEENVISGILQNVLCDEASTSSPSLESQGNNTIMKSDYEPGDQYVHAKQLLKQSLDKETSYTRQQFSSKVQPKVIKRTVPNQSFIVHDGKTTDQDKYKKLRIPESVQKLFSIKKEPIDDDRAMMCESKNSKLITVSYTNGAYKRVLLSDTSSASVVSQLTQATSVASSNSPILVTTHGGLRYIVPQQWLPKTDTQQKLDLGNYSELIKAKFMAGNQKSEGVGTYTTKPLQTSCEPVSTVVTSVMSTIAHSSATGSNLHTHTHVKTEQLRQAHVNILPGTPVQTNTATSVTNIHALPNRTMVQNTPGKKLPIACLGKQNGTGVSQSASALSQSISRIGNVSHVVQQQGLTGLATPTQIVKKNNELAIQPKLIAAKYTRGNEVLPTKQKLPGIDRKEFDKCKFYLMKIDDKNILIPIDADQAQPKTNNQDTVVSLSNVASPVGIRPTLIGLPSIYGGGHVKPTLAVVPNMKQAIQNFKGQFSLIPNSAVSTQGRSLLQTITMTNLAGIASSNVVPKPSIVNVCTSPMMPVVTPNVINVSNYVKPGNPKVDVPAVNSISGLIAHTAKIPVTLVPMLLGKAANTPITGNTYVKHLIDKANTTSSVKSPVYIPITANDVIIHDHSGLPIGLPNVKREKTVFVSAPTTLSPPESVRIAKSSKPINTTAVTSCELSGVVLPVEGCKGNSSQVECTNSEKSEDVIEKPKAFAEAVTTREERLRRLKELLKERQKAVEEIRGNIK